MTIDDAPRQRTPSPNVLRTREAIKAVSPVARRIGAWQAQTVRLVAFAEKLRATGRTEPRLLDEARDLSAEVAAHRQAFLASSAELPTEIAGDGRVLDTMRALKTVADRLDHAIVLLQRPNS